MNHDKNRALEVIEFIQMLNLTDDFYGKPFVLQDWQHEILWDVYGTVNKQGYRQYRYAYLEIPKKNAKTTTIAALALKHLALDAPGGQIYCCAADREQASLTYNAAIQMIEQDEDLQEIFKIIDSKKLIKNKETGTFLRVLSAEAFTKHGINPTVVIFDELHAQPNRELWDVMTFGSGAARKEPLWWVITTSGDDPDKVSIGWEVHEYARKIKNGEIIDPYWYVKIYGAPMDADIFDEKTWYMANPSLGVTIDIESVRQEAIGARNDPSKEKLFRWLRLNQWVSLKSTSWLPLTLWDSSQGDWSRADLVGKKCYAGLDLSSTTDITGLALLFPPQDKLEDWRAIFEAWVPEDNMKKRVKEDHVPYDLWIKNKYMDVTPGDVIDYDFIKARILALAGQYDMEALGCDPWNATQLMNELDKEGINVVEVRQTIACMSPAMKFFEQVIKSGQFSHEKNPVARWCFGNVSVHMDGNENMKPKKVSRKERMDIIVALIDAFFVGHKLYKPESIYRKRGVLWV